MVSGSTSEDIEFDVILVVSRKTIEKI
eukprot:SAG11_NODE_54080_length_101_cov_959.000000_1_plen_27_part_10